MRKPIAIFSLFLFLATITPIRTAQACLCDPLPSYVAYQQALTIFEGEVIQKPLTFVGPDEKLLRVEKVYKGRPGKEVLIFSPPVTMSCISVLKPGIKYLIYAYPYQGMLTVSYCSGTQELSRIQPSDYNVINERMAENNEIDKVISKNTANKKGLLKLKAAHQIYWKDYQQAEATLKRLQEAEPRNRWVVESLLNVLFHLEKPQEILDVYTSSFSAPFPKSGEVKSNNMESAWSYAWISLNKEIPEEARLSLKNAHFKNLKNHHISSNYTSLENVHFINSDLSKSRFNSGDFKKIDFRQSELSETVFKRARFDAFSFIETSLRNADFSDAQFEKGHFSGDLSGATFRNAHFYRVNFGNVTLDGTDFSNARFSNSPLSNLDLSKTNMSGAQLPGVIYTCDTKWPEGFDPAAAGARTQEHCDKLKQAK